MCYAKPGPRCSAHARASLVRAKQALKSTNKFTDPEQYFALKEKEAQARLDFDATPAGQKYLERRIVQYAHYPDAKVEYEDRLALGKARRAAQLAALKSPDQGDVPHEGIKDRDWRPLTPQDFPADDEPREGWQGGKRGNDPRIDAMIDESNRWLHSLTPDEHEAISWYTSDGAHAVNQYLANGTVWREELYTKEHIANTAELVKSAISKYEPSEPHIVWRGLHSDHFDKLDFGGKSRYGEEGQAVIRDYISSTFKPGEEWSPGVSMSTSYDPSSAVGFAHENIVLEIKARKAAPVCVASAWGVSEREAITHPDAKYRVVAIKENVPFRWQGMGGRQSEHTFTVVQLEEI